MAIHLEACAFEAVAAHTGDPGCALGRERAQMEFGEWSVRHRRTPEERRTAVAEELRRMIAKRQRPDQLQLVSKRTRERIERRIARVTAHAYAAKRRREVGTAQATGSDRECMRISDRKRCAEFSWKR